jgi:hypothetical protein
MNNRKTVDASQFSRKLNKTAEEAEIAQEEWNAIFGGDPNESSEEMEYNESVTNDPPCMICSGPMAECNWRIPIQQIVPMGPNILDFSHSSSIENLVWNKMLEEIMAQPKKY